MLIKIALLFLLIAIIGGIYLLSLILRKQWPSQKVAAIHGLVAVTGVLLLMTYSWFAEVKPMLSIIFLVGAVLGGLTMLYRSLSGQTVPKWLALGHGMAAIIGVVSLVVFIII